MSRMAIHQLCSPLKAAKQSVVDSSRSRQLEYPNEAMPLFHHTELLGNQFEEDSPRLAGHVVSLASIEYLLAPKLAVNKK